MQQVLVDANTVRKHVTELKETARANPYTAESVVERADEASQKLDGIYNYLILAFDNKLTISLHKAQVCIFIVFRSGAPL